MASVQPITPLVDDDQRPLLERDNEDDGYGTTQAQGSPAEDYNPETGGLGPTAREPSTGKLLLVLTSGWVGVLFQALDSTIIATLAAPIAASFNSFTLFSWLVTSYLIANAALQPLSGKLSDIFSRRTGLLWANVFFLAGNLICGIAQHEWVLIAGRVVAGLGGGCMNTIPTFMATDLVPLRKRGLWQGVGNLFYGLGAALGGVTGGAISDASNWRVAFLVQVPFSVVTFIAVALTVKGSSESTDKSRLKRVDFLGSFTLVASVVLLLLGLNSGGNIVPWCHPLIYVSLPLSVLCMLAFVYVEDKYAVEPIIPVRLLLHRTVAAGCLTNWIATMAYYAFLFYVPVFYQVQGSSATAAGSRLIPASVGTAIGSLGTGVIMKATGKYYTLSVLAESMFVVAAGIMTQVLQPGAPAWSPFVVIFFAGLAYASMLTVVLTALIGATDHAHQAVITSASYAFRATGSTIGVAIASAVFQNKLRYRLWEELGHVKNGPAIINRLQDNIDAVNRLPEDLKARALDAYMDSLQSVWFSVLGLAIAAAICSLFMKEHVLYSNLQRK
ncbi:MAG: hypothetical protein M1828_003974 [Chrysothrix sp. TS-e1954]|nr:MAG: hypothetical protein M1828_003974 [Chrysothrix sp. TS-e1954]